MKPGVSGFVILNKPSGMTSFQAVSSVRKKGRIKKAGHGGTLDKFAEGVLIVMMGKMTRFSQNVMGLSKIYDALFYLGKETDTLDPEGAVIDESDYIPAQAEIEDALRNFTGTIQQVPPLYSAVHIDGERAYKRARSGEMPEIKAREVHVYSIEMLSYEYPLLHVRVSCSKGTYIRSLARDVARTCGSVGYVQALRRDAIGEFTVGEAVNPDDFEPSGDIIKPRDFISRIGDIAELTVRSSCIDSLMTGKTITDSFFESLPGENGTFSVCSPDGDFLALISRRDNKYEYQFTGDRP